MQVWPKNGTFTALQDIMGVKNPRFIGHFDDGAFEKVELKPLATFGGFVQVWPKNGTFKALQDIMGVKNPRFMGHSDNGAFDKVQLVPPATLGGFDPKWHFKKLCFCDF